MKIRHNHKKSIKAAKYNDKDYTVMYEVYINDKASDKEFDTEDEAYDYAEKLVSKGKSNVKIYKNFYNYNAKSHELSFVDAELCDTVSDKEVKASRVPTRRRAVKASKNHRRIMASTDLSNPYIRIFLTNLGKYNEGELIGEWVDLPVDSFDDVLARIGINDIYEEYFITDYETNIPKLTIDEYENLDTLNDMASQLDDLDESQLLIMAARLDIGESFEEAIAGCDDGSIYYDCYSDQDLGYELVDMLGGPEGLSKDTLEMYFDYDGFGSDARINGSFHEVEPGTLVELY